MGTATDRPLMGPEGRLFSYTFPAERSFRNLDRARQVYRSVVRRTLDFGTTTSVYFATLDLEPTKILVDVALELGQRVLVGKVCMDRHSPDDYCDGLDENLADTMKLIEYIRSHPSQQQFTKE
jgi:guanine deaminase